MRGVSSALLAVFLLVAVLLVVVAVVARSDSQGVTRISGHPVLTVLSQSMRPTFQAGDLVVDKAVTPAQSQHLAVGNIITFRTGDGSELVTHRIIRVNHAVGGTTYTTQGDANNISDSQAVTPDRVVGKFSKRIPYAGYALRTARSRAGLFLLVFLPVLAFVGTEIKRRWSTPTKGSAQGD